jgi:hypothetical protein
VSPKHVIKFLQRPPTSDLTFAIYNYEYIIDHSPKFKTQIERESVGIRGIILKTYHGTTPDAYSSVSSSLFILSFEERVGGASYHPSP